MAQHQADDNGFAATNGSDDDLSNFLLQRLAVQQRELEIDKIFQAVGLPYEYRMAADFPAYAIQSGLFRELKNGEARQDGDVLSWSHHMAIYSTFSTSAEASNATTQRTGSHGTWTQVNDMWTAHHSGGDPYSPGASKYWGSPPRVFRRTQSR